MALAAIGASLSRPFISATLRNVKLCRVDTQRWKHVEKVENKSAPIKFTTSEGYVNYRATQNFYDDRTDLPKSHNAVLAFSFLGALAYLFYLRDDIEADGGKELFKPIHETVPTLAIPLLQAAIMENRRYGRETKELEAKLAECLKDPEKYGMKKAKLVEN